MKKIKNVKTGKEFSSGGNSDLEEIDLEDDCDEYFAPSTIDGGRNIQYARSLERNGFSYLAPVSLERVWYYEAFPIHGTEVRWHFCRFDPRAFECGDKGGPLPVGYCKRNCPGHATEEEAREHFRQYILDKCEYVKQDLTEKCRKCGAPANTIARLAGFLGGMGFVTIPEHDCYILLCDKHANRNALEQLFRLSDFQEFVSD